MKQTVKLLIAFLLGVAINAAIAQRGEPELPPITSPLIAKTAASTYQISSKVMLSCQNDGSFQIEIVPKP